MKLSSEEINVIKSSNVHAYEAMLGYSRTKDLDYPTIKHSTTIEESWIEFDRCFNIKYNKEWANKLRTKYAESKEYYSAIGR